MLLIGIDEAGYGPLLGPLCHGYCALRVPDGATPPDLWKLLAPAVARFPAENGALAIDDSKRVHAAANGFDLLARGVGAFLNGAQPHTLAALLSATELAALEAEPWGRGAELPRPAPHAALREALARAGAEIVACGARALPASAFNTALAANANKADLNAARATDCLQRLLALAAPGETAVAVIDRLGGRKFYADALQPLFPGEMLWVDAESKVESSYRVERPAPTAPSARGRTYGGGTVRISFRVGAECEWLPVALGSMAAKLTRELCMERFNAYFRAHDAALAPTAGYTTDARRFLKDTHSLRQHLNIPDALLIRCK